MINFGSLFSGVEAASAAWGPLGWRTRWVAEVEPTACAVLAERVPEAANLGDVTAVDFADRARRAGRIDVLIGGSPCQAFSIAGKRGELSDPRGRLTLRYVELVDDLDPEILVWENVPGVLVVGRDNAFGCLLAGLAGEEGGPLQPAGKKWTDCGVVYGPRRSVAWRRLGAQHFGLASVRDRVIVVASRNPAVDAFDVLAECEGEGLDHQALDAAREAHAAGGDGDRPRQPGFRYRIPRLRTETIVGPVFGVVDGETVREGLFPTITARASAGGRMNYVAYQTTDGPVLRKTMVAEEERLLGFSGQWTEVPMKGVMLSDTARSKLMGNSMPVPMIRWVGERIERALVAAWEASPTNEDFARLAVYRLARQEEKDEAAAEHDAFETIARETEDPDGWRRLSIGQSTGAVSQAVAGVEAS